MSRPLDQPLLLASDCAVLQSHGDWVHPQDTLVEVASRMRELGARALPVRGADERLICVITDRDIVIRCIAAGFDPYTMTAGDLAPDPSLTEDTAADIDAVLDLMQTDRRNRLQITENLLHVGRR